MDFLRICKCSVAIVAVFALAEIGASAVSIANSVSLVQHDLYFTSHNLALNLGQLNATLAGTSKQLLAQTAGVTGNVATLAQSANRATVDLDATLKGLDAATGSASTLLASANAVASDPNIPKLIRSSRALVDQSTLTMSHVRSVADTIALTAPDIANSAKGFTKSADRIASNVSIVSDKFLAPEPWYRKVWNITKTAAGISKFF